MKKRENRKTACSKTATMRNKMRLLKSFSEMTARRTTGKSELVIGPTLEISKIKRRSIVATTVRIFSEAITEQITIAYKFDKVKLKFKHLILSSHTIDI